MVDELMACQWLRVEDACAVSFCVEHVRVHVMFCL